MNYIIGKNPCPRCVSQGRDRQGNNFMYYGEGLGGFCFSCGHTVLSDDEREKRGIDDYIWEEDVATKEIITQEEVEQIKEYTGEESKSFRGITTATSQKYRVRYKYSEEDGSVVEQFIPVTQEYTIAGYKVRKVPKDFYSVGKIGKDSDLVGQIHFKKAQGKYVVLTAGELDMLSAYQILEDYRKSKNSDFDPIPVVSSVIGETGSDKQIQKHYEWLDRFERIVVCYDNDEVGKKALDALFKVLPKGKMFVMELVLKDTNKYLEECKQKQWIDLFFKAKPYTPAGIVGSSTLYDKILEQAQTPKVMFPPFMKKLNVMTCGGIPLGSIVNLGSASGTGKTSITNECIYYWIYNSPHKIGVVSLELDSGQYGEAMLSRHLGRKIALFESVEEKVEYLQSDFVRESQENLFKTNTGEDRWMLVDERDGDLKSLQKTIEQLIASCDCRVIVLDPLQDLLEGLSNEEQGLFMKWQKGMTKSHQVTFININHVRKNGTGKEANSAGAFISEEDFAGSSTIFKSAACNILFTRNKYAEDPVEQNTTNMIVSKCRWSGRTGVAGEFYYDNETHTMYDKEEWLLTHHSEF